MYFLKMINPQYNFCWVINRRSGTRVNCGSYNLCLRAVKSVMRILLGSLSIYPGLEAALDTQKQYSDSISLPDVLSIRNVSELYSRLSDEFRSKNEITLTIPEGAEADLSFIQLIESARRQAKEQGKTFRLSSPVHGPVLKVLERAGILETFNQEDAKFWLHREVTQ